MTTTLTVPGAVPEGLPGTDARPKGPRGSHAPHGGGRGNGPNGQNRGPGPGGGHGKKRGRGNRHRMRQATHSRGADAQPSDDAPRAVVPPIVDDDIGNR